METLGCQMNRLDSELLVGLLRQAGHEMVDSVKRADVVLYNTCSVRQHAEDKVYSRLGVDARRKADGKNLIVGVLGCMAQREGAKLARRYPAVDIMLGPGQLYRLPALLERAASGQGDGNLLAALDPSRKDKHADRRADAEALEVVDMSRDPHGGSSPSQAFVRIMRGCDKFCSYCIVPYVRGPETSRAPAAIEEEVRRLVDAGKSEITLLGQTVNSYRHETTGRTDRLSDLLARLSPIAGLRRLRFVTSYPTDFGQDLIEAMRDLPNVCRFIHCPPQHGSDRVLKAMNRKYAVEEFNDIVARAREAMPDVAIVGDFIVGFPGETDEDHAATADLVRRTEFKNIFVFKYSPRPGTNAARLLADDIPEAVKKKRNNHLLAIQRKAGLAHHERYVRQSVEVLVTGPSPKQRKDATPTDRPQLVGRTAGDHIVVFEGPADLADTYATVAITAADHLTLFGEL